MKELEKNIVNTYSSNIKYFEKEQKDLFDKITLFEEGLSTGLIKERYFLEYVDDYFDVYDSFENKFIYNTSSLIYSQNLVNQITFNSKINSFKTFYDYKYSDDVVEASKKSNILSSSVFTISPIIHYVNENLPEEEELITIYNYIIFGVVLGLHIPLIHKKINSKIYHIVEPSLELFRLSLFIIDYSALSTSSELNFYILEDEQVFYNKFNKNYYETFFYNHYIKFFLFSQNCEKYINTLQDLFVSQPHYIYSFDRELMSLGRTFEYINEEFKYIDISKTNKFKEFSNLPVLLLAAGPSLQKNIEFVKKAQKKYIIVAIYGTIPFLEKHNIIPDIVVQYDEGYEGVYDTIKEIKNLDFFKNTIFLFSSHLNVNVMNSFIKSNIYVFQAMFKAKENFASLTSPSVGEIAFALINILGFEKIYLLGIDMALEPETNKSHYDGYISNQATEGKEIVSNETYNFKKNIVKIKGNFLEEINTLPFYKTSIKHISMFAKQFSIFDKKFFNLSNGAYLEGIEPLKIDDINLRNFLEIDKNNINDTIKSTLDTISSKSLSEEDLFINSRKLEDAEKIKNYLASFRKNKSKNAQEFKNSLHLLHKQLCAEYVCYDLQKILNNYYNNIIHYIFYMFNLKSLKISTKHIKFFQEILYKQFMKIIDVYIRIIS